MRATVGTHLDAASTAYVESLAHALRGLLGDDLVAMYVVGSGVLGGWLPGRSDIDVAAVCAAPLDLAAKQRVAAALSHDVLPCPAPKLELVLYAAGRDGFEVNLNTGPAIDDHVSFDPADESPHWFVLDRAVGDRAAEPILGPPWREVFAPVARPDVLAALAVGLAWQEAEEPGGANTVLAACRAWRYAEDDLISSKPDAAAWARGHVADAALVDAALALRNGLQASLDPDAAAAFVRAARERLERG